LKRTIQFWVSPFRKIIELVRDYFGRVPKGESRAARWVKFTNPEKAGIILQRCDDHRGEHPNSTITFLEYPTEFAGTANAVKVPLSEFESTNPPICVQKTSI
jgi:hypothetical protein